MLPAALHRDQHAAHLGAEGGREVLTAPRAPLGFWPSLALVVGNLIGSGIYLLPATLAPLGGNALIGWGVTVVGAMCLAYVFARLAATLPLAGGPYAYASAAFGRATGFAVAWSYWVLIWSGNGAVAVAVISALSLIVPALGTTPALPALAAVTLVWLMVAANIRGVALAGRIQLVTTVLKLAPLLGVVVVAGLLLGRHGDAALAANPPVPLAGGAIAGAAAITFWGFLGVESATVPADKVVDAARTVPRVTLIGTAATGLIYVAVSTAIALLMPREAVAASPAPVAAFLGLAFGSGIAAAVALFAAISAAGALNGFILLQGEVPRAMARGGVFPAWFGEEGERGTPVRAHLVSGALVTVVTLANYARALADLFVFVASVSLAAGMLAYLVSALAALRLRPRERGLGVAALVAAGFVLWMVYGLGVKADLWGLALLAAGVPVYLWSRRAPVTPAGAAAP